ncbi:LysR substrate-binding domain-containing protein [Azohydromonas caseinilytica]|uniref:LysR family transcriptional regulator n=1 Tax=Azohydromonas caseinilytica TaxID=2728836 RepID=A0A848FN08_9BURK|nr:LysR substrate-binding domain-containing protein [Azohydromonas caseinilytica]NML19101.1 LysR family transcriptional regulator [Azohydromonas caseinilytica]
MRASIPPLSTLVAFEAVARRLNFTVAANELFLTPSAVSHQIAKLEEFLGVRLFERTARNVELTQAGQDYLKRVAGALAAISAATDSARKGVSNTLHVHSTPSFATLWLMPRLAEFARAHPDISLSLSSSVEHSDFTAGQVDIDIRYGVPNWPQLVVQPVFNEQITPLASPAFLRRHRIETPEDLLQVPLIQSTVSVVQWPDWFTSRGIAHSPATFAYRFDRAFMTLDAAVQGLGVALESTFIGEPHLQKGRLRPVFEPGWALPVQAHFLVYPVRHAQRGEVLSFVDWLRQRAGSP